MAPRSQQVFTLAERCCRSGKVQPDSIFQTAEKELKTSPRPWTTTVTQPWHALGLFHHLNINVIPARFAIRQSTYIGQEGRRALARIFALACQQFEAEFRPFVRYPRWFRPDPQIKFFTSDLSILVHETLSSTTLA